MLPSTTTFESMLNLGLEGPIASGSPLANSASIASLAAVTDYTTLPNSMLIGTWLHVIAFGTISTPGSGVPTLNLQLMYGGTGGTSLCSTGAVQPPISYANSNWRFEADVVVRTTGASGSCVASGFVLGIVTNAATVNQMPVTGLAAVTIDTTAAKAITLAATWGSAVASTSITCFSMLIESRGA